MKTLSTLLALCARNPPVNKRPVIWPFFHSLFQQAVEQTFGIARQLSHHDAFVMALLCRDHFVYAPSQWEVMLQCNTVSHWLGSHTELPLVMPCAAFNLCHFLVFGCLRITQLCECYSSKYMSILHCRTAVIKCLVCHIHIFLWQFLP